MLIDTAIRKARPKDKTYRLADAGGLSLVVGQETKVWRFEYAIRNQRRSMTFGQYPAMSLADARLKREEAKAAVARGVDPKEVVTAETKAKAPADGSTFEQVARRWHNSSLNLWRPHHAALILHRLERDIFPEIGAMQIADISRKLMLVTIRKIEDRGALEQASRIKNNCNQIYLFARDEDLVEVNPVADIGRALKRRPKVEHRAAIPPDELPALFAAFARYEGAAQTLDALRFTLHTFTRTNEVRFAKHREFEGIDGKAPLWRIPKERMKMGRQHLVPLSPQAVAIYRRLREIGDGLEWLVPSFTRSNVISENTMLYALYRMGYHSRLTVHGFRGIASAALHRAKRFNEHDDPTPIFQKDWIEMQLSHDNETDSSRPYNEPENAAKYIDERRHMMKWYSDFLDRAEEEGRLIG